MKLKIYIGIICLILSSFPITSTKLFKTNEKTLSSNSLSAKSTNLITNKSLSTQGGNYAWQILPAMKLFKELALTIFDYTDALAGRKCVDAIERGDLGQTPYKELWDICVSINSEFFQKKDAEQQKGAGAASNQLGYKNLDKWDEIIINEFKILIALTRNDYVKKDCEPLFSKMKGNVNDLINILNKPGYMGLKFNPAKNEQFITSQYSIYRQNLPTDAFKRINDASARMLLNYNNIIKGNDALARHIPNAPKLYAPNHDMPKEVKLVLKSFLFTNYFNF